MPPWTADPHYRSFAGERIVTDKEIALLKAWVDQGAPAGKKKGSTIAIIKGKGILNADPDMELAMKEPFPIKGVNKHQYICYKIPFELEKDTFARAISFVPGNRQLVHHASYQILEVADDVDMYNSPDYFFFNDTINSIDNVRDYTFFKLIAKNGQNPVETFHNGWLPGTSPHQFGEGIGFRMPKKGVLIIRNLHYSPTTIDQYDQSKVQIWFSDKPVKRKVGFAAFKPTYIEAGKEYKIPADSIVKHTITVKINSDFSMLSINPHMHLLGKSFRVYAINPSKDTIPLVYIPKWDFNWQEFYRFKNPIYVPKGSTLYGEAWFDNTSKNVNNPNSPPQDMFFERGNMDDTEEMMRLVFLYLPYKKGDEEMVLE
jgi:hypothetical protein